MNKYQRYKESLHFSLNFYSVFLLVTFIPDIIGFEKDIIKYGFWGAKAVLACWIIFKYHRKIFILNWGEKLFLAVGLIYFINIFIDVFLNNFPIGMGSTFDLFDFSITLLVALSFRYDPAFFSTKSFNFFTITLGLGLILAFFLAQENDFPLQGRFYANSNVNSIVYGQLGSIMALTAIYGFFTIKKLKQKSLFLFLFLLGLVSIMKAGSRSPIVVLVIVGGIFAFARLAFWKATIITIFIGLISFLTIDFIVELTEVFGSDIAMRVESAIDKGETSGRDKIYANTIKLIKENPLFGSYYLVSSGEGKGMYPHNFFLEAFMTTGILGGIPFLAMVVLVIFKSFKLIQLNHSTSWSVLLFLQVLVYGMLSSALYSSQEFWALCLFILSMPQDMNEQQLGRNTD